MVGGAESKMSLSLVLPVYIYCSCLRVRYSLYSVLMCFSLIHVWGVLGVSRYSWLGIFHFLWCVNLVLFSVTCVGSISRDAWVSNLFFVKRDETTLYTWLIPNFPYLKCICLPWMLCGICDVGILISCDLWLKFFYFPWSVMGTPQYPPPPTWFA